LKNCFAVCDVSKSQNLSFPPQLSRFSLEAAKSRHE